MTKFWPPFTQMLSEFCASLKFEDLPPSTLGRAKLCVLDWIAATMAGCRIESAQIIEGVIDKLKGAPQSSIVGRSSKVPSPFAALVNGTSSTTLEIDDVLRDVPLHPAGVVIPAALALAEQVEADGANLLCSVVAGYEVAGRTMMALGLSHYEYWHSTGTAGTLGAAASSSRILNLPRDKFAGALGLGGTQASGLWEQINQKAVMVKHFHGGKSAMAGVFSSLLAAEGLLGAKTVVEGEKGLIRATSTASAEDINKAVESMGSLFIIESNFFKPYACCRGCFDAIDSVKAILSDEAIQPEEIESIELVTRRSTAWLVGNPDPTDIFAAKFSVQFAVALILTGKKVSYEDFSLELLQNRTIKEIMYRTTIIVDPAQKERGFRVVIRKKNGASLSTSLISSGLDETGVIDKFRAISSNIVGKERTRQIERLLNDLDKSSTILPLTDLLRRV